MGWADDEADMEAATTGSPAGLLSAVTLQLRALSTHDRALVDGFVAADPHYTRTSFGHDPSSQDVDALLGGAPEGAPAGAYRVLGAFLGAGTLVGVVQSVHRWSTPISCYIGLLQVHPAHRGHGIGTSLLAVTEQVARTQECRQLLLAVIAGNTDARAFWHRQGFHLLTPHRTRAADPLDPVLMHKPL
jgi:ribosomal protein S18 acetylase RimI-like enzyme